MAMTRRIRIALVTAAMAGGIALAGASPASAQVRFRGSFPVPHGRISVGIGAPFFGVGAVVPYGYTVIDDPAYGYGFYYQSRWVPVERYGSSWIVCDRPVFGGRAFAGTRAGFRARGAFGGDRFERGRAFRRDFDGRREFQRGSDRGRGFDRGRPFQRDNRGRAVRRDDRGGRDRDRGGRR